MCRKADELRFSCFLGTFTAYPYVILLNYTLASDSSNVCRSTTADRKGIDNRCGSDIEANLTALVDSVLDPLREWYGKPIVVNSGYRCPALNKAVGGATTSQHMSGQAADIDTGDRQQNKLLFEHIRKNLPFDQLIDESNFAWVHVSYRADGRNRNQVLKL